VASRSVVAVNVQAPGKEGEEFIIENDLTVGTAPDCDIKTSLLELSGESHRLVEKKASGYVLRIPADCDGFITVGENSLPIRGIIEFGLLQKHDNSYLFKLPSDNDCSVTIGDLSLSFTRKEIDLPEKKAVKLPLEFRRRWVSKEDYAFIAILIVSALILSTIAGYLRSIEIKKEPPQEAIKKIAPRFAKLILKPPKKEPVRKTALPEAKAKNEEKPEPDKEKKEPEKKKEEPLKEAKIKDKKPVTEESRKRAKIAKRAGSKKALMSKGILGVITSKAIPDVIASNKIYSAADNVTKTAGRSGTSRNVEKLLSSFKGFDEAAGNTDVSDLIDGTSEGSNSKRTISAIMSEKKEVSLEDASRKKKSIHSDAGTPKREEAEVYRTLRRYVGGLKYLYNNALKKDASLKGKIVVKITIQDDGKVKEAAMISSTLDSEKLEKRIIKRIHKWQFAEVKGSDDFTINYTFDFAPVG